MRDVFEILFLFLYKKTLPSNRQVKAVQNEKNCCCTDIDLHFYSLLPAFLPTTISSIYRLPDKPPDGNRYRLCVVLTTLWRPLQKEDGRWQD